MQGQLQPAEDDSRGLSCSRRRTHLAGGAVVFEPVNDDQSVRQRVFEYPVQLILVEHLGRSSNVLVLVQEGKVQWRGCSLQSAAAAAQSLMQARWTVTANGCQAQRCAAAAAHLDDAVCGAGRVLLCEVHIGVQQQRLDDVLIL